MLAKEGMVTKGVTFNVNDPDQKEMLSYCNKRTNFSSYIKRLIQRDMVEKKLEGFNKEADKRHKRMEEGLISDTFRADDEDGDVH